MGVCLYAKEIRRIGPEKNVGFESGLWTKVNLAHLCSEWIFVGCMGSGAFDWIKNVLGRRFLEYWFLDLEGTHEA